MRISDWSSDVCSSDLLGLLKGKLEKNIADGSYKRFYLHKTGHWIGLDVHDVGDYRIDGQSRLLEPDMVFTIEPGLYISPDDKSVAAKWRGIGIRTEDDIVVTKDGHEVLTEALARSADENEELMADRKSETDHRPAYDGSDISTHTTRRRDAALRTPTHTTDWIDKAHSRPTTQQRQN